MDEKMNNPRKTLDESAENDHMLVPEIVEVRDSLGFLAVQVLAARKDIAKMSYLEMLEELFEITHELHDAYDDFRTSIP